MSATKRTLSAVKNSDEAVELARTERVKALGEPNTPDSDEQLQATREALESPRDPVDEQGDADTADESDGPPDVFDMTDARRVGSATQHTDADGPIAFGKPSGRASLELDERLEQFDRGQESRELYEWVWATLASWSLNGEHDVDYWADTHAFADSIQLLRGLTLGGATGNR